MDCSLAHCPVRRRCLARGHRRRAHRVSGGRRRRDADRPRPRHRRAVRRRAGRRHRIDRDRRRRDRAQGRRTRFVSVRVPGGEVGRSASRDGRRADASVRRARRLFSQARAPTRSGGPVGLTMGVYRVQTDPRTGRPSSRPPIVAGQTASLGPRRARRSRRRLMPIQEFESLVRLVIAPAGQAVPGEAADEPPSPPHSAVPLVASRSPLVLAERVPEAGRTSRHGGSSACRVDQMPVRYLVTNRDVTGVTARSFRRRSTARSATWTHVPRPRPSPRSSWASPAPSRASTTRLR